MFKTNKYCIFLLIFFTCFDAFYNKIWASESEKQILIISSYNPDSHITATNITAFMDEYSALDGKNHIVIENMNCRSFSEAHLWKGRMRTILNKYKGEKKPEFIILLGQEAWATYFSQQDYVSSDITVLSAMGSRNGVILPDNSTKYSLKNWMPESVDFLSPQIAKHLNGGFVFDYDIDSNIKLILELYPETKNIAFISDNTYGGVSIQAFARKEISEKYPDLNLILLDGRHHTFYSIIKELTQLPEQTAILIATWRIDESDSYFLRNAIYAMMGATAHIPAFTLSTIGLGYWAIGGVTPNYQDFGKNLARQVRRLQVDKNSACKENLVTLINNVLRFDYSKLQQLNLHKSDFPDGTIFVNKRPSLYELYKYWLWGAVFFIFVIITAYLVLLYFYHRAKKLNTALELSEVNLREAKERAEESDRLKSAFLANISHEIRTPLNAIVGFSNVLITEEMEKEEQQTFFDIINTNSELLLRIINDVLDISRMETDKFFFSFEKSDIIELTKQVIILIKQTKKSTNEIIFKSEFERLELVTDVRRLQQVIINLLLNAIKFTENGTITVEIIVDKPNNNVTFAIADTGIGIPIEKQRLIFERFEKTNEYTQGTGLGLAICELIVERWGGKIWVDPQYNNGAKFIFTHPIELPSKLVQQTH
ncbi:sensor histidine kinase [Bacteroides sp. 214]|uniref:sensor histidine kinase n=1 Tax=Bacteroides sp. 214 TaxID=2302935 RepID=UPI0013D38068|nr:HAMP domain-containing sensor histidine kinase [Bacteroides sp. 214]NDW11570.1 sensor histidine kinase [Bacteroides sp. 214]